MRMWSKEVGEDDMTMLQDVSDETIAENLEHRLNAGIIYTYIGRVLIAVNPYKDLDIYGADILDVYCKDGSKVDELECEMRAITVPLHRDRVSRCSTAKLPAFEPHRKYLENLYTHKGPKPPHIYALTTDMYHNMMIEKENQCVIISGESGAGKTTSARHVINCINEVSGRGSERIQQIKDVITQSNVVLEAFGNAKTIRNNNSSRFGKYLEIHFNQKGQPNGGKIYKFVLEKCRVTHLAQSERNFHVFYQLLSGCTNQEKGQFGLQGNAEDYFYLNQSDVHTIDSKDDKRDFLEMRTALEMVGVDTAKQRIIFKVLSAILTLGNIEFKETENVACPTEQKLLDCLSKLLGINRENLEEKLVSVFMETRRGGRVEITKKTNNKCQAVAARDALSKALYSHLFDYLVQVINGALKKYKDYLSIGILDIYGFESFKENSFDQFAINYMNEKLHQVCVGFTFTIEQEEYIREGIAWKTVDYFNNKIVCELIESKRPSGIMSALDEVCCSVKSEKEEFERTFIQKMREIAGSNKAYLGLLQVHDDYFTVKHFAGKVVYEFGGFCERNKEEMSNDLISLMQSSENSFVKDLFPETVYAGGQGGQKTNTGSAMIKFQTNGVIGKIMACSPHYVRCIKPSEQKAPLAWNQQRVINQIRYLGFKESIAIRKTGFAIRRNFECILRRFGVIAPETKHGWSGDRAEACRFILRAAGFDSGKWIIGKTKLFLKEPDALHDLENIKNKHINKACVMIQRNYRRHSIEKQYDEKKQAAVVIQRCYRAYRHRVASKFRGNSFAPRMEWKPQNQDILAEMFQSTRELTIERKSHPESFTMLMKTIFGPSGGGIHCKGIWLEISERSLTTATKELCLHICNCKEEFTPLKTGEHLISEVVALGPNKDPLRAPAKLCLSLYEMSADHQLFLRWSPTQVGEEAQWKDVFPGTFKGKFAGPTVILQIVNTKQVKVTTNTFGLFCIISREPSKIDSHQNDEREVKSGSLLSQGISGIIKLVGQKFRSEKEERFGQDQEMSERIALIK